jgi:hypothetical protein
VFICGPSGVGKKVLINEVINDIIEYESPLFAENPGCIPVVSVEARAALKGGFDFTQFFQTALCNMNKPVFPSRRSSESLDRLINALNLCETKALIINEAQHILFSNSRSADASVDVLKTLANCSNAAIVPIGTYSLATYLKDFSENKVDQINRRSKIIDFHRYRYEGDEKMLFGNIAKRFMLNAPFEHSSEELIYKHHRYFYDNSLGLIGLLKTWFIDACSYALSQNSNKLTMDHFKYTRKPDKIIDNLSATIIEGEKLIRTLLNDDVTKSGDEL